MIKAEELLQIKDDSDIKFTLQMSNIHGINNKMQSSLIDAKVNFSDETFLEITKNLKDRDISLYENIFFSDEEEELLQVEQKNKDCDINFLIHKQEKVTSSSTKKNDYKNIINDETPSQNVTNISNLSLPKIILVDSTKNNGSIVNKVKSTNDKELQTEENFCIKESNDNIFEIESDENNELSSKELSIKCILPTQETIGINTNDPVITDDIQLNSNKELLKSNNLKESSKTIQTSENIDAETNNGKEIPLENRKMDMFIAENQCLETVDKTICDKEPNIISKLQNMNWLKSRASFDVINMSHASKPALKSLPKKDEQNKDYIPKYENSNNKHRSNDTIQNSNHKDISDSSKQNNAQRQTNAAPSKNSWGNNNNSAKNLLPNTQSLIIDRTKGGEELNLALSENICTAQQENLKCKISAKSLKANIQDDSNNNYWKRTHKNLPDNLCEGTILSSNDENQAKGFIDQFGRVDGYSEKRLFIGKGARKKEQDFIKTHTENKYRLQNNQGFLQPQTLIRKLDVEPNSHEEQKEIKKQHENYAEAVLPNRNKEKFMYGKFTNECDYPETDMLINKHDYKTVYNQTTSKYVNHKCKEDYLKSNQDLVYKNQDTKGKSQSYVYQNQNFLIRGQEYNQNQEQSIRHQNYYDKYQEYINRNNERLNRQQNYSDKNYENIKKRQEFLNRYSNYDRNQDIAIKCKGYFNKNQEYCNRNKNYTENYNRNINDLNKHLKYAHPAKRRFGKCFNDEHWMNRNNLPFQKYSDNNSQQECNQWKTRSQMQETKLSSSFDQYQSSDYQEDQINVDNKVDTLVQMDVKQEKQCANYKSPNEEFSDNWAMPYVITDSNSKKSYSSQNPNISKIPNHPMNHAITTSEVKTINEIMQNSMISETRTSLTKEETKFSNNFDQPKNTNQQEGQVNLDNKIDTLVQMNIKQEEQSVNVHLSKQEHPDNWAMSHVITDSNLDRAIDILQKANISITQNHSMNQTTSANTKKLNEAKHLISETKTTSIIDKCTNPKSVQEDSNSDLQPNAITVESNQNIQHALGSVHTRVCNTPQNINLTTMKDEVPCFSEVVDDNAVMLTYPDQSGQFHQNMPCMSYEVPTRIHHNPVMNINAIPFIAGNNQGLVGQIPELPSAAFNVFPDEQQQICMNEISNSSQNLLSLHNTVCNLSKQLASAQANLLAAQVKFYQDAVSCSTNTHNQLPTQSQNLSITTDVHSAKYSTLPTIQPPMPNVQKIQNDSYALHKNFPTHNVQDFCPPSYQANATIEPRLDLQPMYIQQNHFHHQQQHPNFQQYYLNTQPTNSFLRGKVQGSIEGKES